MAQLTWNHNFYWQSMKPGGGGKPSPKFEKILIQTFGSLDGFKKNFVENCMQLGSGWGWLVMDTGLPKITWTTYHDTPLLNFQTPLLTIDLWEHAYYLDYQSDKAAYVNGYLDRLVNWEFAEKNLLDYEKPQPGK
jgi:Fe-Mn family superoxide dismutase